ncbi:hypothetical protein PG993_004939 [Apiospora rasikravindrae]|uniref:Ribonuclease H2 subunit B n=1 Tax=Apiospora rasikravindrae TaxID=990691 RepID=A0ABR1TG69_9PEZI
MASKRCQQPHTDSTGRHGEDDALQSRQWQRRSKVIGGDSPGALQQIPIYAAYDRYEPPKIFILPRKATNEARVVSLPNPRYNKPTRYLVCPETGIYEFTRITAPKSTPRSWLIDINANDGTGAEDKEKPDPQKSDGDDREFGAYVTKGAELYLATSIDPVFLLLPALVSEETARGEGGKKMFVESDDYFDQLSKASPHFSEILRWGSIRQLLESRMATVCDTVDAGGELMYRFSKEKFLTEMLSKAKRMSENSLPPSMEEKFVANALEAPVLGLKREDTTTTDSSASTPKAESTESTENTTSHTSGASTATTLVVDEEATAAASDLKASMQASPEVTKLQRLRVAFSFICSSYTPPPQVSQLKQQLLEQKKLVDFSPLDDYLAQVAKLRQEAASSRSMGDYSRKHVLDEEELMDRAEKKRKMEDDEKRKKAGESRGVKNLKKVNTSGMKKMSDFFKKKT